MPNTFQLGFIAVLLSLCVFMFLNTRKAESVMEISNSRHYPVCFHCSETRLYIKVQEDGGLIFSGKVMSKFELIDALRQHLEFQSEPMVSIVSDSTTDVGDVMNLTDNIKSNFPNVVIGWSVE